jgi:glutathione synthase/RimK-type ligase-like ATP-grasp enzyme
LTCVTNDGNEARAFIKKLNEQGKNVIFKPLTALKNDLIATRLITSRQVLDEELSLAPVIFQECIERGQDIRVCVVGHDLFSASIRANYPELIDWRLDPNYKTEPYELDKMTKAKIRKFMRIIKLDTGSIDLRRAPRAPNDLNLRSKI